MDIRVDVDLSCSPGDLLPLVNDLTKYPSWMGLVHSAVADSNDESWIVELRGKIGPFARSKRLRMVRVALPDNGHYRFERNEGTGRSHSDWVLESIVTQKDPSANITSLAMTLHYSGRLFTGVVERLLQDEIEASKKRLAELVKN